MATTIETTNGEYRIYHKAEAGAPELHTTGEWFYEPSDYAEGSVWSDGYPTEAEAREAAISEADTDAAEREWQRQRGI